MKRVINGLKNAAFFLLCFAQIPLTVGYAVIEDCLPLLMVQAALLPISFLISLLPGKVGGKPKNQVTMVVRTSRGSDPDPDRALRNEALPEPQRRAFPLRALGCLIGAIGVLAGVFFLPVDAIRNLGLFNRIIVSVVMAVMLPLAVRVVAVNADNSNSVTAGMLLYVIAGVIAFINKDPTLEKWLLICGAAFLLLTGFAVNNASMARGASVREGVRPPAGMRRKNRALLIGFGVVVCGVVYFDQIRQKTIDALSWIGVKLWRLLLFLTNLLVGGEAEVGTGGGGGDMDLGAVFGPAETGAFWKYSETLMFILGILGGGAVLVWFVIQVYKLVASLVRKLIAKLKKFTESVGEEYSDEQENLFDWGETKKELGDGIRKRLERLLTREKKWEQMDVRERVRFIVRSLYRKTPDNGSLRALTVHEALETVKTGQAQPEELAELYDLARYSDKEPDMEAAERIRKEAKV